MITVRLGKLFQDRYNKENSCNKTAKEIFVDVIGPLCFKCVEKKQLRYIARSKFCHPTSKTRILQECNIDKYYPINMAGFIKDVETMTNVTTALNAFGGCANVISTKNKYDPQSTEHCVSDISNLNIDERYLSFIGSVFTFSINDWDISILSSDYVWDVYQGLKIYRLLLDGDGETLSKLTEGKQSVAWNTIFLVKRIIKNERSLKLQDVIKNGKLNANSYKNLYYLLRIILHYNVSFIEVECFGDTNKTASTILVDLKLLRTKQDLLEQVFTNIGYDSDEVKVCKYAEVFKNSIFYTFLQTGKISENVYSYKKEWDDLKDKRLIIKFLELSMTNERNEWVQQCCDALQEVHDKKNPQVRPDELIDNLFKAQTIERFISVLGDLKKNYGYKTVVGVADMIDNLTNKRDFDIFKSLLKYNYISK